MTEEKDMAGSKTSKTDDQDQAPAEGLASTGNTADLAVSQQDAVKLQAESTEEPAAHQDSAPEELTKLADAAEEQGFLGVVRESKPDYSQRNPAVMNQA